MLRNLRDSYRYYKEETEKPVPLNIYLNVTQEFIKFLMNKVLEGEKIKLPEGMGTVFVKGKKVKLKVGENGEIVGAPPDWVKTKQLWEECPECKESKKLVYHLNEHTNGIRYKIFWSRKNSLIRNKSLYSLIFTRTNKRTLHNLIKNGKEFIYIDY